MATEIRGVSGIVDASTEQRTLTPVYPERKPLSKKELYIRLIGALAIIAGTMGMGVKHHFDFDVPTTPAGIWQDIKGIPLEYPYTIAKWQQNKTVDKEFEKPVLSTFNNNEVDRQLIQAGVNAIPVSQEELPSLLENSIKPLGEGKFPDVTILLPVMLGVDQKIAVRRDWVDQAWNPITQKPGLEFGKIITIAQRGTKIIVPVEKAEVSIGTTNVQGKDYVSNFSISFKGPDNTLYGLLFYSPEDIRGLQPTDIIKKALADGKKKISLPIGTPFATTDIDNLVVSASLHTHLAVPLQGGTSDLRSKYSFATREDGGRQVIVFLPK